MAVVRVHVDYDDGQRWRDLWLLTLDEHGRCEHFEEWPFAPDQDDGHRHERLTGSNAEHHNAGMLFAQVVAVSEALSGARSRTAKVEALAVLLRSLAPEEIGVAVGFLVGTVRRPRGRRMGDAAQDRGRRRRCPP